MTARRERQVVEIAALVVAGDQERAAGLALEHIVEFPDDAELLARVVSDELRTMKRTWRRHGCRVGMPARSWLSTLAKSWALSQSRSRWRRSLEVVVVLVGLAGVEDLGVVEQLDVAGLGSPSRRGRRGRWRWSR